VFGLVATQRSDGPSAAGAVCRVQAMTAPRASKLIDGWVLSMSGLVKVICWWSAGVPNVVAWNNCSGANSPPGPTCSVHTAHHLPPSALMSAVGIVTWLPAAVDSTRVGKKTPACVRLVTPIPLGLPTASVIRYRR
jgi:hypothetical protein